MKIILTYKVLSSYTNANIRILADIFMEECGYLPPGVLIKFHIT